MATTKQRGPGAPRREDSRNGLIRALKRGQSHIDWVTVETLEGITPAKSRLHQVWNRAATTCRKDNPNRAFTCATDATVAEGAIMVSMTVKRTA